MSRSPSCRGLSWLLSGALAGLPVTSARADEPVPPTDSEPPSPVTPDTPSGTSSPVATDPPAPAPVIPQPAPGAALSAAAAVGARRAETIYRRPRASLLASGSVLFAAGWVADIGFTYGYGHEPAWTSLIPFAGPFIQLTERYGLDGAPIDTGSVDADARANKTLDSANNTIRGLAFTGAILSGVAQLTGLALIIAGAATKRKVTRYVDARGTLRLRF